MTRSFTSLQINGFVTAFVSVGRLNTFLHEVSRHSSGLHVANEQTEMIDEFAEGYQARPVNPAHIEAQEQGLIRIKNALFTWGSAVGDTTPDFKLRIPDITFVKGKINLIAGPTGSGKSSLLKVRSSRIDGDAGG